MVDPVLAQVAAHARYLDTALHASRPALLAIRCARIMCAFAHCTVCTVWILCVQPLQPVHCIQIAYFSAPLCKAQQWIA
jgi:hypothetical protein